MEVREPSAKYLAKAAYKQTEVGVIPEDWNITRITDVATTVSSGKSRANSDFGDFPVYGSTGIIGHCDRPQYAGRAILVARVGANAGKLALVDGAYGVTDNTIIVRLNDSCCLEYFLLQLV
jgi:type I restriction enzyme S subunit